MRLAASICGAIAVEKRGAGTISLAARQSYTGATRIAEDSQRRNALQDAGWHIITVTGNQLPDEPTMDEIAAQIIRKLGIRQRNTPRQMMLRRGALFKLLTETD